MTSHLIKVEEITDFAIRLPDGFAKEGEKLSLSFDEEDNSIKISKFCTIEVDIDKETLFKLMLMAHDRDITLNDLCNEILLEYINES